MCIFVKWICFNRLGHSEINENEMAPNQIQWHNNDKTSSFLRIGLLNPFTSKTLFALHSCAIRDLFLLFLCVRLFVCSCRVRTRISYQGHNCFLQHCSRFFIHNVTSFFAPLASNPSRALVFCGCALFFPIFIFSSFFYRAFHLSFCSPVWFGCFCIPSFSDVLALFRLFAVRFFRFGSWFLPI